MSSLPKLLKLKDYVTLIGTVLGILALICAIMGSRFLISTGFFLVANCLAIDLLDGYIARKTGTKNKFGIQLDSLSDSLTFGIAPAILTYQAFKTDTLYDFILIIGCVIFALAAILRLARFNIITEDTPGYIGLPVPLSALLLIGFFYANYFYAFGMGGISYPFPEFSIYIIPLFMILIAWFNITTKIRFGEKKKVIYIIVIVLAPFGPIFAIIGMMQPNFVVSMILSFTFWIGILLLLILIISGFFTRIKESKT